MKQNVGPDSDICGDCGEPVEVYDPNEADSWIHSVEANYWGDHTAWVESPRSSSEIQPESKIERKHC